MMPGHKVNTSDDGNEDSASDMMVGTMGRIVRMLLSPGF